MVNMKKNFSLNSTEKLYIVCCFLICFLWSCLFLSADYGPDEYMRYEIPLYIFRTGTLPYGDEPVLRFEIWGFSYGFGLTLPYLTSALFMKLASFLAGPAFPLLIAARFTGILSYTGTVYYAMRIGKKRLSAPGQWMFVFLMSLTPQLVFLGSYFNLDIFALFTVMMILAG